MSIKIYVKYVKNNRDFHTTKLNLPTGALDEGTGDDVMKLFQRLKMKDRAIIIVTHDSKVAEYCDRIIYLRDGVNTQKFL